MDQFFPFTDPKGVTHSQVTPYFLDRIIHIAATIFNLYNDPKQILLINFTAFYRRTRLNECRDSTIKKRLKALLLGQQNINPSIQKNWLLNYSMNRVK